MKHLLAAAAATLTLGAAAVGLAPAAHAGVTNPAEHPSPITVKGDDGKTYTDGQDTLPGYDDVECTYIPGAWFDFDNDRVRYADGQSIPWTEWDRATGYDAWKAKHDSSTSSAPPAAKPSSKPASTTTTKPSSGGGTRTTTSKKPSRAAAPSAVASAPPSTSATPAQGATAAPTPTEAAVPGTAAASAAVSTDAAAPVTSESSSPSAEAATDAQLTEVAADTTGSPLSGLAIIGGLVALGALLVGGNVVYRRSRKESVQ